MIRVRFAPSPTGYLHIGGVRTALFNFLYAKGQGGEFYLRIEDTDRERSKPEYEEEILKSLSWLGLHWDGDLVRQSERLIHYREHAQTLIKQGLAYEAMTEGKTAVKFKMPTSSEGRSHKKMVFHDLVHGPLEFDASLFEDLVILKSDGYPTYHWACVIDDHEMGITHVIRGDDHISNTPRQILLYEALGWKPPKFAHLPLILGNDGTPLSKRHGAVSLTHFRKLGFMPEGLLNYLALLGWGTTGNEELYTCENLVKHFSLKRVNKANARFSMEKLEWLNAQHLKRLPDSEYIARISDFYPELSRKFVQNWKDLVLLYKSRIKTWKDLEEQASYFFSEIHYEDSQTYSQLITDSSRTYLKAWAQSAEALSDFDNLEVLEKMTRRAADSMKVEAKDLIHPLRFALTGKTISPGLFELMKVLGKETCLERVRKVLSL